MAFLQSNAAVLSISLRSFIVVSVDRISLHFRGALHTGQHVALRVGNFKPNPKSAAGRVDDAVDHFDHGAVAACERRLGFDRDAVTNLGLAMHRRWQSRTSNDVC